MVEVAELINGLFDQNDRRAYSCLQGLEAESERADDVYKYFNIFEKMLDNENSYVRTRGILLIVANARWDTDRKIDGMINKFLEHIGDVKPITARQCIKSLPLLAKCKPDLKPVIMGALHTADLSIYEPGMQDLIFHDIGETWDKIDRGL